MIRLVARIVVNLLANAVALVVAAQLLDDMSLGLGGFVLAVVIFTVTSVLIEPLLRQLALTNAPAILGGTALVATLLSLIVTAILTSSLSISGLTTWALATVIVWLVALLARILLPFVVFTKVLAEGASRRSDRGPSHTR